VATASEVVRVVVEVPTACLDELRVVMESEASTDTSEVVQVVQHFSALRGRCAVDAPDHAGRELVNRFLDDAVVLPVGVEDRNLDPAGKVVGVPAHD
jgi:hypothetical protein